MKLEVKFGINVCQEAIDWIINLFNVVREVASCAQCATMGHNTSQWARSNELHTKGFNF